MTERNEHDARADRSVFAPAIARLRDELANFEQQASATRTLIEALVIRAGATDPTAKIATVKVPPRRRHRSSRATSKAQKCAPAHTVQHVPTKPAPVTEADVAKELAKIVAAVARGLRDVEAAIRNKDAARLKTAVAAVATAERCGGEILSKLDGTVKPLPVSHADRKRWKEAATRSQTAFEAKLQRDVAAALRRIGGSGADAATAGKTTPSSPPPAPPRSSAKSRPAARCQPHAKPRELSARLSDWHTEPDGSLSRTLTSVAKDDAAAVVPAGPA